MITGKDLKRMVSLIPDDAYVTVNGNYDVSVESVKVESADPFGYIHSDLKLTSGYSITKDSVLEEMFKLNDPDFKLGWISPDGDTYSCAFTNHNKCAKMIAMKYYPDARFPERTLDKNGWLQVMDSWDGTQQHHGQFVYTEKGFITKRQADKLFDLGLYNNSEVQQMIKDSENDW